MRLFISIQILISCMVYGSKKRLDIYRSMNCIALVMRAVYCLLYTDVQKSLIDTCIMYITYTSLDFLLLLLSHSKRPELLLHHAFTIFSYVHLYNTTGYNDAYIAHMFLLAELLSVFNLILRHTILLIYWRRMVIIFIRMPIWIYMIYIHTQLDQNFTSKILYKSAGILMPILDIFFLIKTLSYPRIAYPMVKN